MNSTDIKQRFSTTFKWATIEALASQGLLALNQLGLFRVLGKASYGYIAVGFSLIYLGVTVVSAGFDQALVAFFNEYSCTKSSWQAMLRQQGAIQIGFLLVGGLFAAVLYPLVTLPVTGFIYTLWTISALCESLKKSLRVLAQLHMHTQATTTVELLTVIGYLCVVWGCYLRGLPLGPQLIFIPLAIKSLIDVIFLCIVLGRVYSRLPQGAAPPVSMRRWMQSRMSNYINQLSMMVFSSNFLIPVFAYLYGVPSIGILKVSSSFAVFVYRLIDKAYRTSAGVVLAVLKQASAAKKSEVVSGMTNQLLHILAICALFVGINGKVIFCFFCDPQAEYVLALLFFFVVIFENAFIIYERLAVVEERLYMLVAVNLISAVICYSLISLLPMPLGGAIVLLFIARVVTFGLVIYLYRRLANIVYHPRVHPFVILGALVISCIVFMSTYAF